MSGYREERRRDQAAEADQRRADQAAADARRAERQRAADERAARLRAQDRKDKEKGAAARAAARAERRTARAAALAPEALYRTGTLALVVASGLAALPAQILHFVHISPMLLPLPLALEGAAWVMAAGVAHADGRGLPGWVRWLLRVLVLACAGFAASINYRYGAGLPGLSGSEAAVAGWGLAAVSLLGPLVFEVRQWVMTLTASTGGPGDRERRRHVRRRRRHHRPVARVADRLQTAAPCGALTVEQAWARAWEIVHGTSEPGMTPGLHRAAARSASALAGARRPSPELVRERITSGLRLAGWARPGVPDAVPAGPASPQAATQVPPAPKAPGKGTRRRPVPPRRRKGDGQPFHVAARVAAAETARQAAVAAESAAWSGESAVAVRWVMDGGGGPMPARTVDPTGAPLGGAR